MPQFSFNPKSLVLNFSLFLALTHWLELFIKNQICYLLEVVHPHLGNLPGFLRLRYENEGLNSWLVQNLDIAM